MKTFLGLTTGALLGFIGGVFYTSLAIITNKDLREYCEKSAIDD